MKTGGYSHMPWDPTAPFRRLAVTAFLIASTLTIVDAHGETDDSSGSLHLDWGAHETLVRQLETTIPQLIQRGRVEGLQIAMIYEGEVVWHGAFGVKNADSREPVSDGTIFEAASLTKPLFGYAVMKLVEQGVLELDTPVIEYMTAGEVEQLLRHPLDAEGFRRDWLEAITVRHILSHSSGMPHGESGDVFPLFFEPGSSYKYSADGYYWLQLAVARLTGEPLVETMRRLVFDPLKMTESSVVWRDDYESKMANGHDVIGRPQAFRRRTLPHVAASLYTTATDYARFVCAVLNAEGLDAEIHREMLSPQIDVSDDMGLAWSLGFGLQEDGNGAAFWQWGDYGIFRNYVLAYPEHGLGLVYLTNSYFGLGIGQELIAETIGGNALGLEYLDYPQYESSLTKFTWEVRG
jgi:CubicO group peptidase (beta-lactamase class C family)